MTAAADAPGGPGAVPAAGAAGPAWGPPGLALRICPNAVLTTTALSTVLFVAWLGSLSALVFLLAGLALWARQPTRAVGDVLRWWPVHLIAIWCVLSVFWSNAPAVTLDRSLQLGITLLIAVAMGTRLSPRTFVLCAFVAFGMAAVASLLFGQVREDGLGWIGIFGSKNAFAFAMSVFAMLGLALLLDRRGGRLRLLGAAGFALGAVLLVLGQSAGALVSTVAACAIGLGLVGLRALPPGGRLLAPGLLLLAAVAAGMVAWGFRAEIAAGFLDATGKDVTLTGRTELWAAAWGEIRAHPLLGQGFYAVWVPGNPVAEAMWARFGIEGRMGFNFHNTWLHNATETGLVGVGLQLGLFLATLALVGRWAVAKQTAASLFFAMFMAHQAAVSMVEVVVYSNFSMNTILVVAALVYGWRVHAEAGARQLTT